MEIGKLSQEIIKRRSELFALLRDKAEISGIEEIEILFSPATSDFRLGYFVPEDNLIVISSALMDSGNDEVIENVFLHELAHAMAYKKYLSLEHDSTFRTCCHLLGVKDDFDKARIRLNLEKNRNAERKVQKLIALSSSPYSAEAEEALKKARKIIAEYGLRKRENTEPDDEIFYVTVLSKNRFQIYEKYLASLVKLLTGTFFLIEKHREKKNNITFYGNFEQTECALYLWNYLYSGLDEEFEKRRKEDPDLDRRNFLSGLVLKLYERVKGEEKITKMLMLSADENMRKLKELSRLRITTRRSRSSVFESYSFNKGKEAGNAFRIPEKGKVWKGVRAIGK